LNNISFCHSEPASLAGEESALAGQKQIPRAIELRFGMTTLSSCTTTGFCGGENVTVA
jgi:hypothetical protein